LSAPSLPAVFDTLQNALLRHGDVVQAHLLKQPAKQAFTFKQQ